MENTGYRKTVIFTVILLAALVVGIALSVSVGAADINVINVWKSILNPDLTNTENAIINEMRLPRVLGGILVGACFSVSGAIMQGITRNPLADSGLLGINSGATLAMAICLAFLPGLSFNQLVVVSFLGAAFGAMLVFGISSASKSGMTPFRLTMAGAVVSAFLVALSQGIAIHFNLSQDLAFWYAGGISGITWSQLQILFPIIGIGVIAAIFISPSITILNLGEEIATGLGQKTILVKFTGMLIVIVLSGLAVSIAGNVAYVGLIIPHIVKFMVGGKYQYIIPFSALLGGVFVLIADMLARTINAPFETPLGALTSLIGVPVFIYLVKTKGRE